MARAHGSLARVALAGALGLVLGVPLGMPLGGGAALAAAPATSVDDGTAAAVTAYPVSVSATGTEALVGTTSVLRGTVVAATPGSTVMLARWAAGAWYRVTTTTQDAAGGFRLRVVPPGRGTWAYRVLARSPSGALLGSAVVPLVRYTRAFPLRGCRYSYGSSHHDYPATDIFAAVGCPFVATVSGRVDEVSYRDTWSPATDLGASRGGLSVSYVGDDGVRYYGSHLSAVVSGIRPGVRVRVGEALGVVGRTGSARATSSHLHFGLSWPTRSGVWWVRRGVLPPYPYLGSWRAGGNASPAPALAALRARVGTEPRCTAAC